MKKREIKFVIDENGCHICISHARDRDGYIKCKRDGKQTCMHRYLYEQEYGDMPNNIVIRHKCDNPSCLNLKHLESGTQAENMKDKADRGRSARQYGERNPNSKLMDSQINEIRESKQTLKKLASEYGVSFSLIGQIKRKEIRTHTQVV